MLRKLISDVLVQNSTSGAENHSNRRATSWKGKTLGRMLENAALQLRKSTVVCGVSSRRRNKQRFPNRDCRERLSVATRDVEHASACNGDTLSPGGGGSRRRTHECVLHKGRKSSHRGKRLRCSSADNERSNKRFLPYRRSSPRRSFGPRSPARHRSLAQVALSLTRYGVLGRLVGIEPTTFGSTDRRSNQLSYSRRAEFGGLSTILACRPSPETQKGPDTRSCGHPGGIRGPGQPSAGLDRIDVQHIILRRSVY